MQSMKTGDTDLFRTLNSAEVVGVLTGSALIATDSQGLIVAFSPDAEAILGLKSSDILNHPVSSLPGPLAAFLSSFLKGHKPSNDFSFEFHRTGHGSVTLLAKAHRLAAPQGSAAGIVAVLRDATARKQVEQHLRRLNTLASIGTLSASMAHEIKNALVASRTFVELLLEKHPEDELAGIVRRETNRIDAIVAQMLRFSAPGKSDFSRVSLHEALDHSLRLITPKLQAKSVTLTRHFAASDDLIEGDAYQLQQAFVNLFLNSIDAISAEGTLSVHTQHAKADDPLSKKVASNGDASYLKLIIADTGDGISPENLAHIFEPFFTTKRTGTGLGLPITRGIIEEHGGIITVESEPKNGTRFIILLPLIER
jgi:two-component system, NtrC family, sensor histidine kinase HydH